MHREAEGRSPRLCLSGEKGLKYKDNGFDIQEGKSEVNDAECMMMSSEKVGF